MRALRLLQPVRTPSGFAVLALVAMALMWVIIPSGAIVRLTDSGLGCPDWPTCEGTITSVTTGHAAIEYTNRILSGIVGVSTDISEHRQIEDRLRESEHFLSQVTASSPAMIYIWDFVEQRTVFTTRTSASHSANSR